MVCFKLKSVKFWLEVITVDCSPLAIENCQTAKPQVRLLDMNNNYQGQN